MGSYEYFRKNETNGNLLIFCQLHRILPVKHTSEMDCCQKSIFQLTRLFKQLFSCSNKNLSNAYHFQVVAAFK